MKETLGALIGAALSTSGCHESPAIREIVSVQIQRLDVPKEARGPDLTFRVSDKDSAVAVLARTLQRCRGPEMVKFKPRYRVLASGRDGTQVTFLVLDEYVKVEGKAFRCSEDVQRLVERALATETPEASER